MGNGIDGSDKLKHITYLPRVCNRIAKKAISRHGTFVIIVTDIHRGQI